MTQLWIGTVELLTEPSRNGDTRAFTNVITWANGLADYKETVESVVCKYDWTLLGIERARPIEDSDEFNQEISDIIAAARHNPNACMIGTLHYYPSRVS
jgi:hypothetical protein